ncbi:glycosyltransferase [Gemmatimonas sp.]|uniref:glycosyltransferase n=1 Tax=Gemmatimonas sp. TaxID=1962908 RepID=UPI0035649F84
MRILWIKTELLHPVDKGGRIRTYQMLREIARNHHVTYLTLDDGGAAPDALDKASEYAHVVARVPFAPPAKGSAAFYQALALNVFSSLPYAVARYRSGQMERAITKHAKDADLVVCDFLAPAVNLPSQIAAPTVLFQHNVEAMLWERHTEVSTSVVRKAYMGEQFRRMAKFEGDACRRLDHVIAVSEEDAEVMRQRYSAPSVSSVPTGVDVEYFTPTGRVTRNPNEIVFTGSMDWMPNDDAMVWFLQDILPRIRDRMPSVVVTVVGREPSERLHSLADRLGGVEVTGRVPDVRPYLERAAAFIVPMRVGGGTRLKIFEAMAMGLPVVSTAIGAEGLPLQNNSTILLRDQPEAFANGIFEMLANDGSLSEIGRTGQQLVRHSFGWHGVATQFMAQCDDAIARKAQRNSTDGASLRAGSR